MQLGVVISYARYYFQISCSFRKALLEVTGVQLQGVVKRFTGTVSNLFTAVTLQILLYLAFRVV
jgi:hypothetical protein